MERHRRVSELQGHGAGRAVALLGDDQIGLTDLLRVGRGPFLIAFVVILLTVQHHYHVGVLLDGPGFAQVGQHGLVRLPPLWIAVELREYEKQSCYLGYNIALYLGGGLYDSEDRKTHIAITPGVKLTYTIGLLRPLAEPYFGISYPLIRELDGGEWEFADAPIVTLGLRVVFRSMRP